MYFLSAARGCLHASHFCYLMAQHPFGTYAQRSSKYVLLGSSHLRPFSEFATSEAIMITSIYEYARSLADASFHIPNLQVLNNKCTLFHYFLMSCVIMLNKQCNYSHSFKTFSVLQVFDGNQACGS